MICKELVKLTILVSLIISAICVGEAPIETIKQWNLQTYDFPYDWPVNDKDLFNPEQIVTTGLEIGNSRIFLATPRLFSGVPATISAISRDGTGDSPVLMVSDIKTSSSLRLQSWKFQAYPNWSHHTAGLKQYNCSNIGLVSVYRLKIDSCNRLWALDAGVSRSLEDFEITCPPKILVYDLNTDQVVRRFVRILWFWFDWVSFLSGIKYLYRIITDSPLCLFRFSLLRRCYVKTYTTQLI